MAESYFDVITQAINDIAAHGYDNAERVAYWTERIRRAAESSMLSADKMEEMLRDLLTTMYQKMVDKGEIAKFHAGVSRFTIERLKPHLRAELDRRILASANLIKLNRKQAIDKTLQRFQGWSTSIPSGGSEAINRRETKDDFRKALRNLPFEERRVLIDQGHKLRASLSDILAKDGNAIAMIWRSHWREPGYNYREDHKERDKHVYTIRGNWALENGLMKAGSDGYYDDITAVAEEPFCRCWAVWIYTLRDLPRDMLTKKGAEVLAAA